MPVWITFKEPISLPRVIVDYAGKEGRNDDGSAKQWVETYHTDGACLHPQWKRLGDNEWWTEPDETILAYAGLFGPVDKLYSLPYGAWPSLDGAQDGDFCSSPERCKGYSSCPKNYSCSE